MILLRRHKTLCCSIGVLMFWFHLAGGESLQTRSHLENGYRLIQTEQYQQAVEAFRLALEISPQNASAYYGLGETYRYQQQLPLAVKTYRQAIAQEITSDLRGQTYLRLSQIYQQQGRLTEATHAVQLAIADLPASATAQVTLGEIYTRSREFSAAIRAYQRAARLTPEVAVAQAGLGKIYLLQNRLTKAVDCLQEAIRSDPFTASHYYNLSRAYRLSGQLELAQSQMKRFAKIKAYQDRVYDYRESLQLAPNNPYIYVKLAEVHQQVGNLEATADAYQMAITVEPQFVDGYCRLSQVRIEQNLYDRAISHLKTGLQENPNQEKLLKVLGEVTISIQDFSTAIQAYQKLVATSPKQWQYWRTLGLLYVNTRQFDLAVEAFQQAVRVGVDSAQAHNDLARLYAGLNQSLDRAVELANKAVSLSREAQYLDTLAYIYYRCGDYSKAIQAAQAAIQLAPDNLRYQEQQQQIQAAITDAK